ncbi:cbb3-type cytochrome c oxidase subunit II [Roseivirga echinicomitans]
MFDFHKNHKILVNMAIAGFLMLSLLIAVLPASQMQDTEPLPTQTAFTELELEGLKLYIAEGCVACHTQQVRSIAMDNVWGDRPSMPSDYYFSKQRLDVWRQSPSLLGSERTGPDLTNIGKRQPGKDWHLMHLYNPRSVVKESVMPSYSWLFEEKLEDEITDEDVVVPVGSPYFNKPNKKIVATTKALQLLAYLQSLKQPEMPGSSPTFIPQSKKEPVATASTDPNQALLPDGAKLYANVCAACHQANGEGIKGAFPPVAGSPIVTDSNPEMLIKVILMGYDARAEYAQMPPFADQLSDEEIAAIANHERTSWGNNASTLSAEDVKKIRDMVNQQNQ